MLYSPKWTHIAVGALVVLANGSLVRASSPVPESPPKPNTSVKSTSCGPSYGLQLATSTERSHLNVGQMVARGPYSGMEGNFFALRVSPGFVQMANPGLNMGLLSMAEDLPWTEPGVGGERDDPKRDYLRWRIGKEGDSLHLELGLMQTTLGHGSSVRLYQNAPEGAPLALGGILEGQINGGGLVLVMGNFFAPQRFMATRVRVKPLNWIFSPDSALEPNGLDLDPRGEVLGVIIVGASAAADLEAPIDRSAIEDGEQIPDVGARPVAAFGLDLEVPPIDLWVFHFNPYVDGVMLMGRGDGPGYGVHPGLSVGTNAIGLFWLFAFQYYFGTDGYKPWYFDGRYVFERMRTVADNQPKAAMASAAPASHGYTVGLTAQLAEALTLWGEMGDQFPFDPEFGRSYGKLRLGATAGPSMANITCALLREGWQEYDRVFTEDGLTAAIIQGKLSLLFVSFIARYTYSIEHNIQTDERYEDSTFAVGTEFGFSL